MVSFEGQILTRKKVFDILINRASQIEQKTNQEKIENLNNFKNHSADLIKLMENM